MGICVAAGGALLALSASSFTLAWTHSVEKTRWEESWRVDGARLVLEEGRILGTGAGMEPPEGAVLRDGMWTYRPTLPPLKELVLATSASTGGGWQICTEGGCLDLPENGGEAAKISGCRIED